MTTLKHSYIFFIAALSAASWAGNAWAGLTQQLSPGTIAPGERTTLTIALDYKDLVGVDLSDEQSIPELLDEPFGKADGVLLLDRTYERNKTQFVWKYVFTAYVPTTYRLPPVEIRFGAQTFSTTTQPFSVQSGRSDNDDEIRPEFEAEEIATQVSFFWPTLLFILALLGLGAFLLRHRFKRKKKIPDDNKFESPEQWLKRMLTELSAAPSPGVEKFTSILREYLRQRYLAPAHSLTLRELLAAVRQWDGEEGFAAIQELLLKIERMLFNRNPCEQSFLNQAIHTTQTKWLDDKKEKTP